MLATIMYGGRFSFLFCSLVVLTLMFDNGGALQETFYQQTAVDMSGKEVEMADYKDKVGTVFPRSPKFCRIYCIIMNTQILVHRSARRLCQDLVFIRLQ